MAESNQITLARAAAALNPEEASIHSEEHFAYDFDRVLELKDRVSLIVGDDTLHVEERKKWTLQRPSYHQSRLQRWCGIPSPKVPGLIDIPFYNLLWAAIEEDTYIVIEYTVEMSKAKLEVRKLKFALGQVSKVKCRAFIDGLLSRAYGRAQRQRRAKVLVNPHAGPGGAVDLWRNAVRPIFEAARMTLDEVTTTRRGEGTEICEALDIDAYDIVVVCSGDGLAYEVFNGFGNRADARKALKKIAVAHIPCGSGNAMSCNLNGSHHPGPSALAVVKGVRTSVDLMSVTQGSQRMLSFLSQSVGIIAEADLATEHMRWLGARRFDLGVAQRIFSKKVYPCDIAVKVVCQTKDEVKTHYKHIELQDPDWIVVDQIVEGAAPAPGSSDPDAGDGLPPLRFGTVNEPIPEDWQVFPYNNMGNFYCGNMAWMAPTANFFNAACINDGLMDLVTNDGDIPIFQYAGLMTSVESGKFFDNPLISYRKILAYRLIPRNQDDGYISIDGERTPFEPFQVEVHPGLGTVLSKRGRYEATGPPDWQKSA
ncbi:sphingoid long chain base kinase-like protein [Xylaria venustula]|nr:sphingoid long chain base kinase-like protein [Xylaria venustula]